MAFPRQVVTAFGWPPGKLARAVRIVFKFDGFNNVLRIASPEVANFIKNGVGDYTIQILFKNDPGFPWLYALSVESGSPANAPRVYTTGDGSSPPYYELYIKTYDLGGNPADADVDFQMYSVPVSWVK